MEERLYLVYSVQICVIVEAYGLCGQRDGTPLLISHVSLVGNILSQRLPSHLWNGDASLYREVLESLESDTREAGPCRCSVNVNYFNIGDIIIRTVLEPTCGIYRKAPFS